MPAPQPSDFNWLTFVVAAVGAITGVFSAGWAVVPYVSAGAKVRVTIKYVFEVPRGPVLDVGAYNRRRGAVEILDWGLASLGRRGKDGLMFIGHSTRSEGDSARMTLAGLHSASWRVLARDLEVFERNRSQAVKIRAAVELYNEKQIWSKPLRLPAGSLHQIPRIVDGE